MLLKIGAPGKDALAVKNIYCRDISIVLHIAALGSNHAVNNVLVIDITPQK